MTNQFKKSRPEVEIKTITSKQAVAMLELVPDYQRNPRVQRIETIKTDIQEGWYTLSTDAIAFNTRGELVNGQHRLLALSQSPGKSIKSIVLLGLPVESYTSIDTGGKRSLADQLRMLDKKNVSLMASVIRLLYGLDENNPDAANHRPSLIELMRWYLDENEDRINDIDYSKLNYNANTMFLSPSSYVVVHTLLHEIVGDDGAEIVDEFFLGIEGKTENIGNEVARRLVKARNDSKISNSQKYQLSVYQAGWEYYLQGKTGNLVVKPQSRFDFASTYNKLNGIEVAS